MKCSSFNENIIWSTYGYTIINKTNIEEPNEKYILSCRNSSLEEN